MVMVRKITVPSMNEAGQWLGGWFNPINIRDPVVEIRRPHDRFISTMWFSILVRHLYTESGLWLSWTGGEWTDCADHKKKNCPLVDDSKHCVCVELISYQSIRHWCRCHWWERGSSWAGVWTGRHGSRWRSAGTHGGPSHPQHPSRLTSNIASCTETLENSYTDGNEMVTMFNNCTLCGHFPLAAVFRPILLT